MKLLELRFKNLNSLYGEWRIDFTDPEYEAGGIFALTGPTGAGKSTILDAICLALYGATPRLGKITKSSNEIMSRQTGECYAEVVFESRSGRFRCHWEQRRARKNPKGRLQDQEHQIVCADSGKPIETKKSLVGAVIEEKTGMDFDRFTRSILLAQGRFDTFLRAEVEEKSKILEQITGSEIYSEISRQVHERQRNEREKLNLLRAETSGIIILEPDQEQALKEELEAKQKQETALALKVTETGKAIAWLTSIENLKNEIHSLGAEATRLQTAIDNFKPQRILLEQARQAASLDGAYAALTALRSQQATDLTALQKEQWALPDLEVSVKKQAARLKTAEELTSQSKEQLQISAPLIRSTRLLDQKIAEQCKVLQEEIETRARETAMLNAAKEKRKKEEAKRITSETALQTVEQYLREHAKDEWLISGLAGIEEQFANLKGKEQEIAHKKKEVEQARAAAGEAGSKLEAATRQKLLCKNELEQASQNLLQGKAVLKEWLGDKLLREYRTEKETLLRERAYIKKIENLENLRSKLQNGQPCPLCGATEHPVTEGSVPVADEIDQKIQSLTRIITGAEEQESAIKRLEDLETDIRGHLADTEKTETNVANDQKTAEKIYLEGREWLIKLQASFEEQKKAVGLKLKQLDYAGDFTDPTSIINNLKSKMQKWQEQVRQQTVIEKQIVTMNSEIKSLEAVIATRTEALNEKQKKLEQLRQQVTADKEKRRKVYGDKNPDAKERELNTAVTKAEAAEKQARLEHTKKQQLLTAATTHIDDLKKRLLQREPKLQQSEADFSSCLAALKPAGFTDEKMFLAARMSKENREALALQAQKLDEAQTDLRAREKDRQTRLATEMGKKLTEQNLEELETRFREYEANLKQLREERAALKHKLLENQAAKERIQEQQSAIEAQKKECVRFDKLHTLIGSADGKKYRNFAQGLTFKIMVSHANRQLEKMNDRYLLVRDNQQPLELNVADNYQAGEIRSTRNLSGGESFIVSLSLALGLSQMASQKVQVDSLFLDEGFGTLDEETLETALETLSCLQQDGKIIGIISHVSALKERISTQISVLPGSGGRSTLKGPGCARPEKQKNEPTL